MSEKTYERPSFFKALVNDDFFNCLRIPPLFLKIVGGNLQNKFVLWNHQRRYWDVFAEKVEETLWFKKGWEDFVRDNALKFGDFVVFFYAGNSNFDVVAYGKSCCEKVSVIANTISQPAVNQVEEKSAVEAQPVNNGVGILNIKSDDSDVEETRQNLRTRHFYRNSKGGKSNPEEAASKFSSKYPHFQVRICWSYLNKYLSIPAEFSKKYTDTKKDSIMLRVSDKSWPVWVRKVGSSFRISKGWKAFAKDNCLQIGDICIFKMIEEAFHVTICRD